MEIAMKGGAGGLNCTCPNWMVIAKNHEVRLPNVMNNVSFNMVINYDQSWFPNPVERGSHKNFHIHEGGGGKVKSDIFSSK